MGVVYPILFQLRRISTHFALEFQTCLNSSLPDTDLSHTELGITTLNRHRA